MSFGSPIYSVLCVDSDQKRLDAFESAFRKDYHIFTVDSTDAALEIMEQRTVQLVIADLKLQRIGGLRFLEKVLSKPIQYSRIYSIIPQLYVVHMVRSILIMVLK